MATAQTKRDDALHEVQQALLSLIASVAVAPIPNPDALLIVGGLMEDWGNNQLASLRGRVERLLRTFSGASNMENIVRHLHELRQKMREYQRMDAE